MKIAVLGNGPVALEVALDFHLEGADVRVIGKNNPCSKLARLASLSPDTAIDSQNYIQAKTLESLNLSGPFESFQGLWDNYYSPLISFLGKEGVLHQREVLRVQKRFLEKDEAIENHTRLYDLFRITYGLNPSGLVDEQLKENPELKEKLTEDILQSLKNQVESFEDFDLVFDCRGDFQRPIPIGSGGHFALNEKSIAEFGSIHYGLPSSKGLEELTKNKVLTLVGSGVGAALTFLSLEEWLKEEGNILNIISSEKNLFSKVLKSENFHETLKTRLRTLISEHMETWRQNCLATEKELHKWRDLPLHEKNKIPQPQFPEPKLRLFEGYSISSVDRLIDRDGLFLTLEIPQWRDSDKKELVTVAQDQVIAVVGYRPDHHFNESLAQEEPGYFTFFKGKHHQIPKPSLELLPLVKSEVFKYFSRA